MHPSPERPPRGRSSPPPDHVGVIDLEGSAQDLDLCLCAREVRVGRNDRLELDEVTQSIDLIQMNPHPLPEEEPTLFFDHDLDAKHAGEGRIQLVGLIDLDYPVPALALPGKIRPLVSNQMRDSALLLPQLQAPIRNLEIGVALDQRAVRLGTQFLTGRQ